MNNKIIKLETIKKAFNDKAPKLLGTHNKFSVLVPIVKVNNHLRLLFQIRAKKLKNRPGEISFPGGALEQNETFEDACIRETREELNIKKENINIFGELDYILTPYDAFVKPFIGALENINPDNLDYNKDEVDELFTIPLEFFEKNPPELHYVYLEPKTADDFPFHKVPGGKDYPFKKGKYPVYFYNHDEYNIWGITARIINNFIETYKRFS